MRTDYDVIIIGGGPTGDVIQPVPTFSEVFLHGLTELGAKVPIAA